MDFLHHVQWNNNNVNLHFLNMRQGKQAGNKKQQTLWWQTWYDEVVRWRQDAAVEALPAHCSTMEQPVRNNYGNWQWINIKATIKWHQGWNWIVHQDWPTLQHRQSSEQWQWPQHPRQGNTKRRLVRHQHQCHCNKVQQRNSDSSCSEQPWQ